MTQLTLARSSRVSRSRRDGADQIRYGELVLRHGHPRTVLATTVAPYVDAVCSDITAGRVDAHVVSDYVMLSANQVRAIITGGVEPAAPSVPEETPPPVEAPPTPAEPESTPEPEVPVSEPEPEAEPEVPAQEPEPEAEPEVEAPAPVAMTEDETKKGGKGKKGRG